MVEEHVIWSNEDLDYERDWKDDLEAEYPDLTDDQRMSMMYQINDEYLEDARLNLNVRMPSQIIVIGDLGLWYGRRSGYLDIQSGVISDCLQTHCNAEYGTFFVNKTGDLCARVHHHDGTNHYLYRVFKPGVTDTQKELLKSKIYNGTYTRKDVTRYTTRLGDAIASVYGFKIRKMKGAVMPC